MFVSFPKSNSVDTGASSDVDCFWTVHYSVSFALPSCWRCEFVETAVETDAFRRRFGRLLFEKLLTVITAAALWEGSASSIAAKVNGVPEKGLSLLTNGIRRTERQS